MEKKTLDLKEKTYLLMYGKPNYKSKISDLIYGKECKSINRIWGELEKDNWIKTEKTSVNRIDGRSWSQNNYIANPEILFKSICNNLNDLNDKLAYDVKKRCSVFFLGEKMDISLTDNEKIKLTNLLSSVVFRTYVEGIVEKIDKTYGLGSPFFNFALIKSQFSHYCAYLLFSEIGFATIDADGNDLEIKDELNKRNKKNISNKNLDNLCDGTLSLGYILITKLTFLDNHTCKALFSYFSKILQTFGTIEYYDSVRSFSPLDAILEF